MCEGRKAKQKKALLNQELQDHMIKHWHQIFLMLHLNENFNPFKNWISTFIQIKLFFINLNSGQIFKKLT
jgi:hypothetical protein